MELYSVATHRAVLQINIDNKNYLLTDTSSFRRTNGGAFYRQLLWAHRLEQSVWHQPIRKQVQAGDKNVNCRALASSGHRPAPLWRFVLLWQRVQMSEIVYLRCDASTLWKS